MVRVHGHRRVEGRDLEGIAGQRHSPTLGFSHGILPYVWFVWGLGLVAEEVGAKLRLSNKRDCTIWIWVFIISVP